MSDVAGALHLARFGAAGRTDGWESAITLSTIGARSPTYPAKSGHRFVVAALTNKVPWLKW